MLGLVRRVKASEVASGDTLVLNGGILVYVDEVGDAEGHVMFVTVNKFMPELVFKGEAELNRLERMRYVA